MTFASLARRCTAGCLIAALATVLLGCAQSKSAAWATTRALAFGPPKADIDGAKLDPALRYLRVNVSGLDALLVLGFIDRDRENRPVEVWYSADNEVMRLQGGRLVGLTGTPVEWRNVVLPANLPDWRATGGSASYLRTRDEMPGYRIALPERMTLSPVAPPGNSRLHQLEPAKLQWFREVATPAPDETLGARRDAAAAAPARYAVQRTDGAPRVVYGEQCVAENFCLTWQAWPPGPSAFLQ